jgi:hypothetical protein
VWAAEPPAEPPLAPTPAVTVSKPTTQASPLRTFLGSAGALALVAFVTIFASAPGEAVAHAGAGKRAASSSPSSSGGAASSPAKNAAEARAWIAAWRARKA